MEGGWGLCMALGLFESLLVSLQAFKDLCKPSGILGNWTKFLQTLKLFASFLGSFVILLGSLETGRFSASLWDSLQSS